MRRALVAAAAAALLAVPAARANGDPASDVLIVSKVFIGPEVPLSQGDRDRLTKIVETANERGYKIRVALIPFTGDLGTAVSLWGHPKDYARFLGAELAFAYTGRVMIVMPSGFGIYHRNKPVAKEYRVLAKERSGKTPPELARSAGDAVRALAAANGVTVPEPSSGGHDWRDRIIILVAGLALVGLVLLILRVRGGEQSPFAGLRSSLRRSPGSSDPGTGER